MPPTVGQIHDHVFDVRNPLAERRTRQVMWLTAAMMVVEIVAGTLLGSMALLADGWHRVIPGSFSVGALGFGADLSVPGFRFEEADTTSPYRRPAALAGPLGSILAIRQGTSAARHSGEPLRPGIRHRGYPALEAVPGNGLPRQPLHVPQPYDDAVRQ